MATLTNKIAVVTGASSGIGKAVAESFAGHGATVILVARDHAKLKATAGGSAFVNRGAIAVAADVTSEKSVDELFAQVSQRFGRLDVLVNSAGIVRGGIPTEELSLDLWNQVIASNLTGVFLCSRAAFKIMKPQGKGRIINIGSTSAKSAGRNAAAYTASKFGLEGLTRSLAVDGREFGIAVSIINPGNTDTPVQIGNEDRVKREGVIPPFELARLATLMATLPDDVNLVDSLVIPVRMPFLGRG